MRNRAVTILFFPIFILIFTVGWVLYLTGKREAPNKKTLQKGQRISVKRKAEEVPMEVGLLENLNEESVAAE